MELPCLCDSWYHVNESASEAVSPQNRQQLSSQGEHQQVSPNSSSRIGIQRHTGQMKAGKGHRSLAPFLRASNPLSKVRTSNLEMQSSQLCHSVISSQEQSTAHMASDRNSCCSNSYFKKWMVLEKEIFQPCFLPWEHKTSISQTVTSPQVHHGSCSS